MKIFTRTLVVVHGIVVQESPKRKGRNLTIQTLGDKSWDSGLGTVVLGQWSWDSGLGTVVLGQ